MGAIVTQSDEAFRDYVTDGVPASGANEPVKSEVRAIFPKIEAALADVSLGAAIDVAYATYANMIADTGQAVDTIGLVYSDNQSPPENGIYIYTGSPLAWTETDWVSASAAQAAVEAAAAAAEAAQVAAEVAAADAEAASALAVASGTGMLGALVYQTTADGIAATSDGQYFAVAFTNGDGADIYLNDATVAVAQNIRVPFGDGFDQEVVRRLQASAEVTSAFPASGNRLAHWRAIDGQKTDGQAFPNRWATSAHPVRWNYLNFTTGIIRFASPGSGHTLTLNDDGDAARVLTSASGGVQLVRANVAVPSSYTFAASIARDGGVGSDQSLRGIQSDNYQNITAAVAYATLNIAETTHTQTLTIALNAQSAATYDINIDDLQLVEGGSANLLSTPETFAWHAKGNIAYRGSLPTYQDHGGYLFNMRPTRRFVVVGEWDVAANSFTLPTGHGLVTADGPFSVSRDRLYPSHTFTSSDVNTTTDAVTEANHTLSTGHGPFVFTTTGTLPAGLSTLTPYWVIVDDGNTLAFATSEANALANTRINLTGGGTGTHTITTILPGGLTFGSAYWIHVSGNTGKLCSSAANATAGTAVDVTTTGMPGAGNFILEDFSVRGATMLCNTFPTRRSLTALTIQVTGEWMSQTSSGFLASLIQDSAVSPATGLTTFSLQVGDDGAVAANPNTSLNRARADFRATDMGQQIWTLQFDTVTGNVVLWCGEAPIITAHSYESLSSGAARVALEIIGFWFGRGDTSSPSSQPVGFTSDTRTASFKLWNTWLTYAEVRQAVVAERVQLALEGNSEDTTDRVINVIVGTSIQINISGPVTYPWRLSKKVTQSPVFNMINCAKSAKSLGGATATDFQQYWDWEYGTAAAIEGCFANGWNVILWSASNQTNDVDEIIAATKDAQDFIDFAAQAESITGAALGVNLRIVLGPCPARADGSYGTTFEAVRPTFNSALESLALAAGYDWVDMPTGIDSVAGITANSTGDFKHPNDGMHDEWHDLVRTLFETIHGELVA